jgi:hypothetical protein
MVRRGQASLWITASAQNGTNTANAPAASFQHIARTIIHSNNRYTVCTLTHVPRSVIVKIIGLFALTLCQHFNSAVLLATRSRYYIVDYAVATNARTVRRYRDAANSIL